jgi:hypothetical protein
MAANPATFWFPPIKQLTLNTSGAVEALPTVTQNGGRERVAGGTYTMTGSETAGTAIGIARLPIGAMITGITIVTDTSLGSSTIALGDSGSGNSAIYAAAATYTSTNSPTRVGKATAHMAPITTGYDCVSGLVNYSYEDVIATVAAATLPSSGNLTIIIEYTID